MTRRPTARAPLPQPPPPPSPREAWDALLASLPLDDEQRAALNVAADDLALEAAEAVTSEVSRIAHDVGNAASQGCLSIVTAATHATGNLARAARLRQRGPR